MILTEMQTDALKEVINLGVGYAACSLNELVGTHVTLHVPEVSMLTFEEAKERFHEMGWGILSTVQLQFSGPLKGNVALVFPSDSAVKLVSLLTGDEGNNSDVDGIRAATLEEAGNILLNGVVGSISNLLHNNISFSVPYYSEEAGLPARLVGWAEAAEVHVIFARARFMVAKHEIEGEILLFFEVASLETLVAALDRYTLAST
jgi:chemotaxis protein CheC